MIRYINIEHHSKSILMRIKSRNVLRRSDKKVLLSNIAETLGDFSYLKNKKLEYVVTDKWEFIFVDGKALLFKIGDELFPTVKGALVFNPERRRVVVDSGAVEFIVKGADIMAAGIVEADPNIEVDDLVIVVEEKHGKALAIGRALMSGRQMIGKKGKAVEVIHRVGDEIWKL